MKKNFYKSLIFAFVALLATSCGTTEEFVLLNDLDVDSYYKMQQMQELKIKRGDDLRIVVTHKLPMLAEMFNNKINTVEGGESLTTYTVNGDGYINYPLLDSVKAEGLTCSELEQKMSQIIADRGLAYGATVSVKITNFKVTVIGESGTGIYEFEDGRATIFDLVAKANLVQSNSSFNGGMGIRRDKILIMREVDGVLTSEYVSLLSKDIMFSQYYYLQQNDIIYVEPNSSRARQSWNVPPALSLGMSSVGTLISIATFIITLTK